MYYAQFYQCSATDPNQLVEACGDRSVVVLDGRCSAQWMEEISEAECSRRGYLAWRIFKGESFTRSVPVSQLSFVK